ncbi:MAG: hypothetical protein V3Q69_00955 [Burkholderia sp.]
MPHRARPARLAHELPDIPCPFFGRCCINRARSVDVYAQRSRGQPSIKSDSRVTA